jgi:hypothetical protein
MSCEPVPPQLIHEHAVPRIGKLNWHYRLFKSFWVVNFEHCSTSRPGNNVLASTRILCFRQQLMKLKREFQWRTTAAGA